MKEKYEVKEKSWRKVKAGMEEREIRRGKRRMRVGRCVGGGRGTKKEGKKEIRRGKNKEKYLRGGGEKACGRGEE